MAFGCIFGSFQILAARPQIGNVMIGARFERDRVAGMTLETQQGRCDNLMNG
ncbi:hypothetical protein [Qipengyuania sp.]|uniref:hypothetical protein n=1 Tax=Qipengyuania sp. TaxID=2004515 RepID=UPI0035C7B8DF